MEPHAKTAEWTHEDEETSRSKTAEYFSRWALEDHDNPGLWLSSNGTFEEKEKMRLFFGKPTAVRAAGETTRSTGIVCKVREIIIVIKPE